MTVYTQDFVPPLKLSRPVRRYTLEQFLEKEAKSPHKHEFIDGQIFKMPYAKGPHNIISANMVTEMNINLRKLEKNYVIFPSDQMVYFPSLDQGVYADALAVCEKPLYWDDSQLLLINPIIVVEVLSKSSGTPPASKYDRSGKFDKYKTLESIREYVLIRQDECYAEVWYRERPGRWQETIITDMKGELPLQSVGVTIAMEWIYKNVELKEK
jgi:Uma2 family endonuclease